MMLNCPRCGFSQPNDRYCAKCGVDMETFIPKKEPSWKESVQSPVVFAIIGAVLVMTLIFFARKHHNEEIAARVQFLKGGPVITERKTPLLNPPPPSPRGKASVSNQERTNETIDDLGVAPPAKAAPGPVGESVHVKVLYAEVDHDTMEILQAESLATQQHTDFGDFRAGALPAKIHPSRERGVRVLQKVDRVFDSRTLSQRWFVGRKTPEGEDGLGITNLLTFESFTNSIFKGEIELQRFFVDDTQGEEAPTRKNYPSTSFELTPGMSWMVSMKLPTVPQEDASVPAEGIMNIFQSAQYKSKQTEFTVFFEFDNEKH